VSELGSWEQAAMEHEMGIFHDENLSAHFVGGVIMGMAIAMRHPEYAQAAVRLSQQRYEEDQPGSETVNVGVARFVRAVPVQIRDKDTNGPSPG